MIRVVVVLAAVAAIVGAWPVGAAAGDADAGRQVFQANCAMCHGNDANGMMGMHPSLRGAIERLSREGVEVTIRKGRDTNPPMPAFEGRLDDAEIEQVIAYIDALPAGPRNFGPGTEREMMDGMMGGWMLIGPLLLLVLIVLGVWAVIRSQQRTARSDDPPSAREILDRRYAEGEITREEYLERRSDLDS